MSRFLIGVTGRVTFGVLAVSAVLFSALATIGFVQVASSGREAIRERIEEVLDSLEAGLRAGTGTVAVTTADGVAASVVAPGDPQPAAAPGQQLVARAITLDGQELLIVSRASEARLAENLDALWRALWVAVPLASLLAAVMAGVATRQALRPVGAITALAAGIKDATAMGRVPVPDSGDEIERLATTLNGMLARIERSHIAQRQFTSDAAHELRTPLMALQCELELVAGRPAKVDQALLERLEALAERLAARIDDLLLLATLDEVRPTEATRLALLDLVSEEAVVASADVVGTKATVVADERLLRRAISNLVVNARRHARSHVIATVEPLGDRVWLHVDDDGPGIEPADRAHIFERFARLDEARSRDDGGSGLGLAIVASIANAAGGGVTAATSPTGGARISLWLPSTSAITTADGRSR